MNWSVLGDFAVGLLIGQWLLHRVIPQSIYVVSEWKRGWNQARITTDRVLDEIKAERDS